MNLFIDTHAHVYLDAFDADRQEMMERASEAGIYRIFMPAIDSTTHASMMDMEKKFPQTASMMGLHPCSVGANYEEELAIVEQFLAARDFIAIGEIGLDFYWDRTWEEAQYRAFRYQLELALARDLPVVIHSRDAIDACIAVVAEYKGLRGVFHCFSGNREQAEKITSLGLYLGIGGVVSFKNSGLDKVVEGIDLDRVILETDAPYLAPVPHRGKRNEPSYLELVAGKIGDIRGMSREEVGKLTSENALKLFNKA